MRTSVIFSMLAFGLLLSNTDQQAAASIVVGTLPLVGTDNDNPQDKLPDVLAVIDAYNAAKDPDLTKDIVLFKKSDDDAAFMFSATPPTNGFSFFSDAAGTLPITSEAVFTSLITAYFSYNGPETLEYYSVKVSRGFSLYEFQSGVLNLLTRDDREQEISHVSFWRSTETQEEPPEEEEPPQFSAVSNPEPSTLVLAALSIASLGMARRRRR